MKRAAAAVVVALAFSPAAGSASAAPAPSDDAVRTYLDVLDTADPTAALTVSAPGSAAWRYAEHQTIVESALINVGQPATRDVITVRSDGAQVCTTQTGGGLIGCAMFSEWIADDAGLIVSFTIDGVDISNRLGDPSEPAAGGSVSMAVLSSYRTIADNLVVTLHLSTLGAVDLSASKPTYTGPDDAVIDATDRVGPDTLAAASSVTVVVAFPAADPGGELNWQMVADGTPFDVAVTVPPLGDGVPATPVETTTTTLAATTVAPTEVATTVPAATDTAATTVAAATTLLETTTVPA